MREKRNLVMKKQCCVVIPVYKPDFKFNDCLQALKRQKDVDFDLYIIESGNWTTLYEKDIEGLSCKINHIDIRDFNHGTTRQYAAQKCAEYPIIIFLTQDAIPANEYAFRNLIRCFKDKSVGCAYGRQLPQKYANFFSSRARNYNYPAQSQKKTFANAGRLGIKAVFLSDSFAAYRNEALISVGGFPKGIILGEDMYVAAKMLLAGWANFYCAEAVVIHSHNYSFLQEFKRYFDIGVFHIQQPWILENFGKAEKEGIHLVLAEFKYLFLHRPHLIPNAILRHGMQYFGYWLGRHEQYIPNRIKCCLSMNPNYWS